MLKKSILGLIVISSLASTQASAFIALDVTLLYTYFSGGFVKKPSEVASALSGRHVFPVYKTSENKYFVAIRTSNTDLQVYFVDAPNTSKFHSQIWDAYISAHSAETQPKHNEEALSAILDQLDNSSLVRFVVFGSKDWNKAESTGLAPFSIIDGEFLKSLADARPYFDSADGNLVSASGRFGVWFQASQKRALNLIKSLNSRIESEEARLKADL